MKNRKYTVQGLLSNEVSIKQDEIIAESSTKAIKKFLSKYPNIDFINARAKLSNPNKNSINQYKLFTE